MNNFTDQNDNFDEVDTWLRVLHSTILSLLLLLSTIGYGAVILLVIFHKNLHYRSIVVSMGLVVVDLAVAVEWNFLGLASTIAGEWPFGGVACKWLGTVHLCVLYVRWLEIAVVTFDRFFIILSPFNYYKYSKPLQVIFTILAWLIPLILIATATILDVGIFRFRLTMTTCSIDCFGTEPCYSLYLGVFAAFVIVGGVLPTILYCIMYCIGRKKRSSMKHRLGTLTAGENNSSIVSSADSSGGAVSQSVIQTNRNMKLKDSDQRALVTFFIIFVTLLVTQIPIFITSGALRNTDIFEDIPIWIHFISLYIFLLGPVLTPVVIMRNRDFRRVIARTIRRTRTMPITMTKTQVREFRRNSSVAYSSDSSQTEVDLGPRKGLQISSGIQNLSIMETVVEKPENDPERYEQ